MRKERISFSFQTANSFCPSQNPFSAAVPTDDVETWDTQGRSPQALRLRGARCRDPPLRPRCLPLTSVLTQGVPAHTEEPAATWARSVPPSRRHFQR